MKEHRPPVRFWRLVGIRGYDDCWPWKGRRRGGADNRYGAIGNFQSHRIALAVKLGRPIQPDKLACHTCDNPICCNPNHLYEGTRSDNARDAYDRGRMVDFDRSGEANGNSKLSVSDVKDIKKRIAKGESNVAISKDYPVSHAMISKIRRGHHWAEI